MQSAMYIYLPETQPIYLCPLLYTSTLLTHLSYPCISHGVCAAISRFLYFFLILHALGAALHNAYDDA